MATAELRYLLDLAERAGARTVSIGHGRDPAAVESADSFARAWQRTGGDILATVSWPARAASWLRPARRLVRDGPDLWIIADTASGFAPVARRLVEITGWDPARTLGFGSLAGPEPVFDGLDGLRGATTQLELTHHRRAAAGRGC